MHLRLRFIALLAVAACASDAPSALAPASPAADPQASSSSNLALNADTICFTTYVGAPDPRHDDVRITSTTGSEIPGLVATIEYGPGQPTGWLTTSLTQTTTPARLWLQGTTASMPAGEWWADVRVSAPTGGDARVIRVHINLALHAPNAVVTIARGSFTAADLSPGRGTVAANGSVCNFVADTSCTLKFPIGTELTLRATPDTLNNFLWWRTPACDFSNNPECVMTVQGDVTVGAYFYLDGYSIAVTMVGAGADGRVEGGVFPGVPGFAIECALNGGVQSGTCGAFQREGAKSVGLDALPGPGSVFVGWSGDCPGGLCEARPGADYSVTATFAKQ